ncbi:hypothetical protein ACX3O0_14270 [Homoserinimonas sp. A447]
MTFEQSPDPGPTHWVLTLVCADAPGIVHAITGAIVPAGREEESAIVREILLPFARMSGKVPQLRKGKGAIARVGT